MGTTGSTQCQVWLRMTACWCLGMSASDLPPHAVPNGCKAQAKDAMIAKEVDCSTPRGICLEPGVWKREARFRQPNRWSVSHTTGV